MTIRDLSFRCRWLLAAGLDRLADVVRPQVKARIPDACPSMRAVRLEDGAEFPRPSIEDPFECHPNCGRCDGTGAVCEQHPDRPHGVCECGHWAGVPCNPDRRGSDWSEIGGRPIRANLTITPCEEKTTTDDA